MEIKSHSVCWAICAAVAAAGAGGGAWIAQGAQVEPRIVPTVHPALTPTSAIAAPLRFSADHTTVWRNNEEKRMLLSGRVTVSIGYRRLIADEAAVWLTPSSEAGSDTHDVAIYLSGSVMVREGDSPLATMTSARELLVTTRVSQQVQVLGNLASGSGEDSPIVRRGSELRNEVLNRPPVPIHVPRIVVTTAQEALQAGWIARGPGNRLIPGPGELVVMRDPEGNIIPGATPPQPPRPRPNILVTGDAGRLQRVEGEVLTIMESPYLLFDSRDGKPPLEFHAHRMVAFSPAPEEGAADSAPADGPGGELARRVTGVYFEGDVELTQGENLMVRAERVYYDFTSQRAVMLDATLATVDEQRNVPVYLRASEIRQLARGEFAARKVTFSTSEFHTPHYHIGASEMYLRDVTPELALPNAGAAPGTIDLGPDGGDLADRTYKFQVKDATIQVAGVPIFYWPMLSGDTSMTEIPLRTLRVSNSRTYGLSLLTDWDLFGLTGQPSPDGVRADLTLDYFAKRGPAGGVQALWESDEAHGLLRTYALLEQGTDWLGYQRRDLETDQGTRGRALLRDQRELGEGLTLQVEAAYLSDPNFLEQFFRREFDTDKEQETSIYLKKQGETDALTLLGKANLFDFMSVSDQVDDQHTTEKLPEVKYWRIGDSILDVFTYFSESSGANLRSDITDFTPAELGLMPNFMGLPAGSVPVDARFRQHYRSLGWTTGEVLRADTRHELALPLVLGDVKVTPYITGRATLWDDGFAEDPGGSTTRLWAGGGVRSSMQFWRVYEEVESTFWDVHRLRHVIEPQFNIFAGGASEDRRDLQPFDRDVEGISGASGMQLAVQQKWQTKRGGEGHWRNVDWIVLNVQWNQFWNEDQTGLFHPTQSVRGYYFNSRPELSLVRNSISLDGVWRIGERVRFLGEANYSLDENQIEHAVAGIAVDQSQHLSYFMGNRYIRALDSDEWTFAVDYQLTRKYRIIAAESFDFASGTNILSSVTILRQLPRFNAAITITYDANNSDTSMIFTAWPEGFPNAGFGSRMGASVDRR